VSDKYTVPLCRLRHRELHRYGDEASWWTAVSIDPLPIAVGLWKCSQIDSKVSLATIKRLEATSGELIANRPTIAALQNAVESAGGVFIAENGGGPDVHLRAPVSTKHK
jgi:hypothetical protein